MTSAPSTRWLGLVVLALLGVSTSVAAIRNAEEGGPERGRSELAASQEEAEAAPPETEAPAPSVAPQVSSTFLERPVPSAAPDPAEPAASPASPASPGQDGSPPELPTGPAGMPVGGGRPHAEAHAGPASPAAEPASRPARAGEGESSSPPAQTTPAPESLLDGTATVRLGPVGLVAHLAAADSPGVDSLDADLTVGDDQVIGDAPPAEQTEVAVDGMLIPSGGAALPTGPVLA